MHLAVRDVNELRNVAAQIEQRMQFHRRLGFAKACPGKQRQRQVDCRGIERIGRIVQLHTKAVPGVELARHTNQTQCKVLVDMPVAFLVGIGERTARNAPANTQVVELVRVRAQACFDIAQTLAKRKLRERHSQKLIEVRERQWRVPASIACHATPKRSHWQMIHQLGEDQLAFVHVRAPGYDSPEPRSRTPACSSR